MVVGDSLKILYNAASFLRCVSLFWRFTREKVHNILQIIFVIIRFSTGFLRVYSINCIFIIFDLCNLNTFSVFNSRNTTEVKNKCSVTLKKSCTVPIDK